MRRDSRPAEFWVLIAIVAAFFWRPLTRWTFYFRDLYLLFFPKRVFLADSIRHGVIPLWDPFSQGGLPFLASPNNMPFYPTNALFLVFPPLTAWNLMMVAQYLLAATGGWWAARTFGLSRQAAFATGIGFALAGTMLSASNLFTLFLPLPWIPVALGFAHRALKGEGRWSLALASICVACGLLGGGAEVTGMMIVTIAVWAAASRCQGVTTVRKAAVVGAIVAFAGGLSLVQTLPALQMIGQSQRGFGLKYSTFSFWSVDPRRLPELVFAQFLGPGTTFDLRDYWGRTIESGEYPYIISFYFGLTMLVLAVFGGWIRRKGTDDDIPARAMLALAGAGIFLSMGKHLPFFRAVYDSVPLVTTFRYPVKAMIVSIFPIALLAGRGIDVIRADENARRRASLTLTVSIAALLLCLGAFAMRPGFRSGVAAAFFAQAPTPALLGGVWRSGWRTVWFAAASLAALIWARRNARAGATGLAAILALDLMTAGAPVNFYAPRDFFDASPAVALVKNATGSGRFCALPRDSHWTIRAPDTNQLWRARWDVETLARYTGPFYGIPVTFHEDYDGLAPWRLVELRKKLITIPWDRRIPILQLGGVRAFTTNDTVRAPGVELAGRLPSREKLPLWLYRIPASAMARFVSRTASVPTEQAALDAMVNGADPEALVTTGSDAISPGCGSAPVAVTARSNHAVSYEVAAPCAGFMSFAETWYPGWEVTVDGTRSELLRVNYAFSAVRVGPGRHVVERRYRPRLPLLGFAGTLLSLAILGIVSLRFAATRLPSQAG